MRKALLSVLLILCIVLLVLFMKNGIHIGPFQVFGFESIKEKNEDLTQTISTVSSQSDSYTSALSKLQSDVELLTKAKKDYLDLVAQSTENEIRQATQTKIYTIEYLWSRVGNHATEHGIVLENIEKTTSTLGAEDYSNLKFTVTGEYLAITQFISELENDTTLDFIIDDFHMTASRATFVVKDIIIQKENTTSGGTSTNTNTSTSTSTQQNQNTNTSEDNTGNTVSEDDSETKVLGEES